MSSYSNADAFSRFHMMQRVVDMFDGNINKMIRYGLISQMQDSDEDLEIVEDYDVQWDCSEQKYNLIKKKSRKMTYADILEMHASEMFGTSSANSEDEESEDEVETRSLQVKKGKNKAERKRLKKLRQKERKRQEKEQQKLAQDKETTDIAALDKACDGQSEERLNLKDMAAALDLESSECTPEGSSDEENEELDLTSSFVTKAAEIAKRQMEQKQESKDKKKSPVKEEQKLPEKTCEESHVEKTGTSPGPKMEDFIKMSTDLAAIGNKFATAGKFELAVKYFTDAIKFNPTEYRLFGNRAFCFEKMQQFNKSLNDAELSLSMCPGWVKGLFRKGRALAGLKRYEEAASAFKEVIKLDSACTEATQELVRVQILQLMGYGFTRDESSKALIVHGSVDKAREFLSKLKQSEGSRVAPVLQQVVNVTGLSPVLSAKMAAAAAATAPLPPAQDASKSPPESVIPVQSHQTLAKPEAPVPSKSNYVGQAPELFPVWVGNLSFSVTEPLISNLFNKVGTVYSVKHLPSRRCAFVNFTQQQDCDDAIRRYHGYELFGSKLAVRYPDRIPPGLNISKSAHRSTDLQDEYLMHNGNAAGRNGYTKPYYYNRGPYKY